MLSYAKCCPIVLLTLFSAFPLSAFSKSSTEIFQNVSPSVVVVYGKEHTGKTKSQGSGVVISEGLVVTNCHVVSDLPVVKVKYRNREHSASVKRKDAPRDICILAVSALNAPAATLGTSSQMKVGQRVFAIGAPRGLEQTFTDGIISGFREDKVGRYIQTSAPISPGSSGGGLFDEQGHLVGLPTFYVSDGQQLNFAIPVEWIKDLLAGDVKVTENGDGASTGEILLRCTGYQRMARSQSDMITSSDLFGPAEPTTVTVVMDKQRRTVKSDISNFVVTTDPKSGKILASSARYVENELSYQVTFPEFIALNWEEGGKEGIRLGALYKTFKIDRLSGELTFDVDATSETMFGRAYFRYRKDLKCKPVADRVF